MTVSYAGSSTLAKQIEQAAPADIFFSADLDWMNYLQEKSLIAADTRVTLLGNDIVLVAPLDSDVSVTIAPGFALHEALAGGKLAMAQTDSVPAGKYGKAALQSLGVWDSVVGDLAQADNVRAALALVSRGEASLGIVYATDAEADPGVKVVGSVPGEFASADPLSGCPHHLRQTRRPRLPRLPDVEGGAAGLRGRGLPGRRAQLLIWAEEPHDLHAG